MPEVCRVYWGSHGCHLERGHDGPHLCDPDCMLDADGTPLPTLDENPDAPLVTVGKPPYYGPETKFYGEDA